MPQAERCPRLDRGTNHAGDVPPPSAAQTPPPRLGEESSEPNLIRSRISSPACGGGGREALGGGFWSGRPAIIWSSGPNETAEGPEGKSQTHHDNQTTPPSRTRARSHVRLRGIQIRRQSARGPVHVRRAAPIRNPLPLRHAKRVSAVANNSTRFARLTRSDSGTGTKKAKPLTAGITSRRFIPVRRRRRCRLFALRFWSVETPIFRRAHPAPS